MSALVRVCNKQDEVWVELISFQDRQDAIAHVRHGGLFDPMSGTLQPLACNMKWARWRSNGKHVSYFICCSHEDCPYQVRVKKILHTGLWEVQELHPGQHHSLPARARKNSIAYPWMQAQMLQMADCGAKPGAILGALTSQHIKLCKQLGIEPKKRAEGGLEGALHDVDAVLMVLTGFIVCFGLI